MNFPSTSPLPCKHPLVICCPVTAACPLSSCLSPLRREHHSRARRTWRRPLRASSIHMVDPVEALTVQRRLQVAPTIARDLFIFRSFAAVINPVARRRLGCNAALIVDEFGEKLMEELDYALEATNIQDFYNNFRGDPLVKIPWVRRDLTGKTCLVMEWINGIRCTDPAAIHACPSIEVQDFIQTGVVSGMRQLLEFGLFHGDPHPGNIFALEDGRIAYVDFGNVAQLSQYNKQARRPSLLQRLRPVQQAGAPPLSLRRCAAPLSCSACGHCNKQARRPSPCDAVPRASCAVLAASATRPAAVWPEIRACLCARLLSAALCACALMPLSVRPCIVRQRVQRCCSGVASHLRAASPFVSLSRSGTFSCCMRSRASHGRVRNGCRMGARAHWVPLFQVALTNTRLIISSEPCAASIATIQRSNQRARRTRTTRPTCPAYARRRSLPRARKPRLTKSPAMPT